MIRALAVVALSGLVVANPAQAARAHSQHRQIAPTHLTNGLYTTPDRKVTCRVVGDRISCLGARVFIACAGFVCTPVLGMQAMPKGMEIYDSDEKSPNQQVLAPGVDYRIGELSCSVRRAYIDCGFPDARGGFQMSGIFVRNTNLDTAPPGWPHDGRHYTYKDAFPFMI